MAPDGGRKGTKDERERGGMALVRESPRRIPLVCELNEI